MVIAPEEKLPGHPVSLHDLLSMRNQDSDHTRILKTFHMRENKVGRRITNHGKELNPMQDHHFRNSHLP
jgi:hypothetical protein